jgi:hypothetical protein
MGIVLTINRVKEFPKRITETVVGREEVVIEGAKDTAETRIYESENNDVENYSKFIIQHTQKYKIEGKLWGKNFSSIMRVFTMHLYREDTSKYLFTIGSSKANYAHKALKRLSLSTPVKSEPYEVDLIQAVEKIITYSKDITINSGWFSNLGLPNLNNVLLQGDDVNLGPEWEKFKKTTGASLSNIELSIDDNDFDSGQVKVALSKRGIVFSHTNIPPEKLIEIANKLISILDRDLPKKKN